MRTLVFTLIILFAISNGNTQSYTEGADLDNIAPGPTFVFSGPSIKIAGQMNTPADGSEYFVIDLAATCQIDSVTYTINDPTHVGVGGYFQFGTNNQESYQFPAFPGMASFANATKYPTTPFPFIGPSMIQCQALAGIAWISDWDMTFYGSCVTCIDPDVPVLTASSSTICEGDSVVISISGNLNDATAWVVKTDSCEATSIGSSDSISFVVFPSQSTTYYIRGEGNCVVPGLCASITVTTIGEVNDSVSQTGNVLTANNSNANYQWIDCGNANTPISGETDQTCTHCQSNSGSYAVIVEENGCFDTSDCYTTSITGIEMFSSNEEIKFYTRNQTLLIDLEKDFSSLNIHIFDINGKLVYESYTERSGLIELAFRESPGIYFIRLVSENDVYFGDFILID